MWNWHYFDIFCLFVYIYDRWFFSSFILHQHSASKSNRHSASESMISIYRPFFFVFAIVGNDSSFNVQWFHIWGSFFTLSVISVFFYNKADFDWIKIVKWCERIHFTNENYHWASRKYNVLTLATKNSRETNCEKKKTNKPKRKVHLSWILILGHCIAWRCW